MLRLAFWYAFPSSPFAGAYPQGASASGDSVFIIFLGVPQIKRNVEGSFLLPSTFAVSAE